MILLRVIFIAQLVLLLPVLAHLLVTPVYLDTLAIYLFFTPIGLVVALYALWQLKKHPDRKRLAAATLATPILCLGLPIVAGLASSNSISLPDNIGERDQVIKAAALYFIAVAIPASCLSLFTLLYAPVGLVRNPG